MYLLCCGASFAVIHVDILHGDQGDAIFLPISCRAARGRKEHGLSTEEQEVYVGVKELWGQELEL